jgi:hypothetical protein
MTAMGILLAMIQVLIKRSTVVPDGLSCAICILIGQVVTVDVLSEYFRRPDK